jgi:hypothetical protein
MIGIEIILNYSKYSEYVILNTILYDKIKSTIQYYSKYITMNYNIITKNIACYWRRTFYGAEYNYLPKYYRNENRIRF